MSLNRYQDVGVITHSPLPTDEIIADFRSEYDFRKKIQHLEM